MVYLPIAIAFWCNVTNTRLDSPSDSHSAPSVKLAMPNKDIPLHEAISSSHVRLA